MLNISLYYYTIIFLKLLFTASLNLKSFRGSTLSSISETESEWRSESIIIRNPQMPVIFEGKEVELKLAAVDEESENEETVFGGDDDDDDVASENYVRVNYAIDVK